jgi:general secretion pathway protein A
MYESFYGLRERPFDLSPNPKYLFLTPRHREALANLRYGLTAKRGFIVLTGEAGTGKTTLINAVLQSNACQNVRALYLNNPALTREEFLEFLARGFKLGSDAVRSKIALLADLEQVLVQRKQQGVVTALIIDEAQSMSSELLEEIRLLANIETSAEKLLQIVLAGQQELGDRFNDPSMRQLKQRIALRCSLSLLSIDETAGYIAARIRIAGGDSSRMFTREAVSLIFRRSRGVPRLISVICDNALMAGFALERRTIGVPIVEDVCRDFDLDPDTIPTGRLAEAIAAAEATVPREFEVFGPGDVRREPGARPAAEAARSQNPYMREILAGRPHASEGQEPRKGPDPADRLFKSITEPKKKRRFSFF